MQFGMIPLVLGSLGALTACEERVVPCTQPWIPSVEGTVRDANGIGVPVQSAVMWQRGRESVCQVSGGDFACHGVGAGRARVEVVAASRKLTQDVELTWRAGEEGCHAQAEPVLMVIGDLSCPETQGNALQVSVLDAAGEPANTAAVSVSLASGDSPLSGTHAFCEGEGATINCPAVTPYSAIYYITVVTGHSVIVEAREVHAEQCVVNTEELVIDLSSMDCPTEARPAVFVSAVENATDRLLEFERVRARWESGEAYDCAPDSEFSYICEARGVTGGGRYTIEATIDGEVHRRTVDVKDDGCKPFSGGVNIEL